MISQQCDWSFKTKDLSTEVEWLGLVPLETPKRSTQIDWGFQERQRFTRSLLTGPFPRRSWLQNHRKWKEAMESHSRLACRLSRLSTTFSLRRITICSQILRYWIIKVTTMKVQKTPECSSTRTQIERQCYCEEVRTGSRCPKQCVKIAR